MARQRGSTAVSGDTARMAAMTIPPPAGQRPAAPQAGASWPDGDPDAPGRMLLSARGRISRRRFWMWGVGAMLGGSLVLHGLLAVAGLRGGTAEHVLNLLLLWPAAVISIKRWHDVARSGWWVLVALVPVVGWVWLLAANGLWRGTAGPNPHGPAPLA